MKVTKINSGAYTRNIYLPSGKLVTLVIRHTDATKTFWEIYCPVLIKYIEKDDYLRSKFPDGFGLFKNKKHAVDCCRNLIQDVILQETIDII